MLKQINSQIEEITPKLKELNEFMYHNLEIGLVEYKSVKKHIALLEEYGFKVKAPVINMDTAYIATYDSGKAGPTIAYLAEYDALPGVGHGCGHNLFGAVSLGAGIVLKSLIDELGGSIRVYGTPAEENYGGKVDMASAGLFENCDVAIAAHPITGDDERSGKSQAMEAIEYKFIGKPAHAAGCPQEGINALNGVISLFNNINALKEHLKKDVSIFGIITQGGVAANIVPEIAVARFYVRAQTKAYLQVIIDKVNNCAKGASLAHGTELLISNYEASYDNMVTNEALMDVYDDAFKKIKGKNMKSADPAGSGSTDMGNVSHVIPTIHPYFSFSDMEITGHSSQFADATITPLAYKRMQETIAIMVLTGAKILSDKKVLETIKEEFDN